MTVLDHAFEGVDSLSFQHNLDLENVAGMVALQQTVEFVFARHGDRWSNERTEFHKRTFIESVPPLKKSQGRNYVLIC